MRLVYQLSKPLCFYFEATLVPLPPRLRPAVRSLPRLVQPSDGADTLRSGAERRGAEQRGPTWQQSCPDSSRRTTCSPTSLNFFRSSPRHEPRGTVEFGPRTSNSEVTEKVVFLLRAAGDRHRRPCDKSLRRCLDRTAKVCTRSAGSSTSRDWASRPGISSRWSRLCPEAGGRERGMETEDGSPPVMSRSWR